MDNKSQIYIHPSSYADEGCSIGSDTKIWHFSHIMSGAKIGQNCNIGQNVFVADLVVIGNNVKIQNNVSLYSGIHCEDDVFIGPSVVFTNIKNPRSAIQRRDQYLSTIIEKGCTIGANASIVCGLNLGRYSFVGAGAVVTKDISPYALVVGNPAKQIGWISEYGHRLNFNEKNTAICPESQEQYQLFNNQVKKYPKNVS